MEMYNEEFINDSLKKLSDWQMQAYEPARKMSESAATAYEKYVKLSYAAMGDMVEFYVDQAHMIASTTDPKVFYENQQTAANELSSTVSSRAGEFVDLASELQSEAKDVVMSTIKQAGTAPVAAASAPAPAPAKKPAAKKAPARKAPAKKAPAKAKAAPAAE